MRKITLLLALCIIVAACSAKKRPSDDFVFGSQLYGKFTNYYLKGEARAADKIFNAAEKQFLKLDGLCNLSRIYIGRFTLDEGKGEVALLEKASEYARLGGCESERHAIFYLMGKDYDRLKLPQPFIYTAGAGPLVLKGLAEKDDKFQDVTKSRLYRKSAIGYLMSNPAESYSLAETALKMDKYHGWSLNILRDLVIMKSALIKQGKNSEDINKRIKLIKAALNKK